jgi:hypothetical protein
MNPQDQAKQLRELSLAQFARREAALKSILRDGPKTAEDYQLLASCVGFALAELQTWKAAKLIPPNDKN